MVNEFFYKKLYTRYTSWTKNMIYLALPLQILVLTQYIPVIWTKGYRDKKFIGDVQMIKSLTTNLFFFSLNRVSECFRLKNWTITLLSCPLLFLENANLWQPSISVRSLSIPESLKILTIVFWRCLSGMLFGMPVISTLFLWLYCSPFNWFFWR